MNAFFSVKTDEKKASGVFRACFALFEKKRKKTKKNKKIPL